MNHISPSFCFQQVIQKLVNSESSQEREYVLVLQLNMIRFRSILVVYCSLEPIYFFFLALDRTKLEVCSWHRARSELFGTGRIASWKWKLEKLWAAASKLGQAGRAPSGGCLGLLGVLIGTLSRVLPYITPTWGPPTSCMDWAGTGRSPTYAAKSRSFSANVFRQLYKAHRAL